MTTTTADRRQGVNSGQAVKVAVKAATTANITLSGEQTIDGVSCVAGDRVLVKNQTTASQNGIYDVDTGAWSRSLDFAGAFNVRKGTLVYTNSGSTQASGWFVVTTSDPITIGTTSISFSRLAINYVVKEQHTASAGQTVFTLGTAYQTGANGVAVFVDGIYQTVDDEYSETNSTTVTFAYALEAGQKVTFLVGQAVGNLTAAQAALVAVTDSGDYYVSTTVEGVLQEIAESIAADNGDASATFTNGSSDRVQRWNTPLTANRTLTLSTSNARDGAWVTAVRGAGATGAYTLAIGSLATLHIPGEWARCRYDSGTAAWVLESYGILPSAEILYMTADNGDADATITVGTSPRSQRWATVLTADRTVTLSTSGTYAGARFRIIRSEAASGQYALYVSAASATIATLLRGQWCEVEYNGSAWIVAAKGDIRAPNTHVVHLYDDFLGAEVDGYRWQSLIGTDSACRQGILAQDQLRGLVRLTTGADAGGTMALNGCQFQGNLNWAANQGGLVIEAKLLLSAITNVALFLGFTDQVSALEMPFTLGAGDALTSNATDAVGVLFDTAADTDNWWAVGVKADIDAAKQNLAVAPSAAVMETWRIEVTSAGVASFYRNSSLIGTAMSGAVTPSVQLTPVIAAFARGAASRTVDVDFIDVQAQR